MRPRWTPLCGSVWGSRNFICIAEFVWETPVDLML